MHISMKTDIKQATRKLRGTQRKQIPFATAYALTQTAKQVAAEEVRQMPIKLDRPTPFTAGKTAKGFKAFYIKAANKKHKAMFAQVGLKDKQASYLRYQIQGGTRTPQGRAIGVPVNQKLNKYGNMTRGEIKALLAKPDHFSGTINGVGGIYQRQKKGGVKLIVAWEPRTNYTAGRFPFYKIGVGKARAVMARNMRKAIDYALRSAK